MAKDETPPQITFPVDIVGVDMAKVGSDETVLVVLAETPHGRLTSLIHRRTAAGPHEEITPEAWERAIKEYMEICNVPLLSKRNDGVDGNPDGAGGIEKSGVEDSSKDEG